MKKTKCRIRLCMTLLLINLAVIWGNSLLPGDISGQISRWVRDILRAIFALGEATGETGHGILRKLGHLTEFACLGACLCWLFSMLGKRSWLSIFCGFSVACLDEYIQRFTPNRGPNFWDVCIDTTGAALGMGLLLGAFAIYQKRKTKFGGNSE